MDRRMHAGVRRLTFVLWAIVFWTLLGLFFAGRWIGRGRSIGLRLALQAPLLELPWQASQRARVASG